MSGPNRPDAPQSKCPTCSRTMIAVHVPLLACFPVYKLQERGEDGKPGHLPSLGVDITVENGVPLLTVGHPDGEFGLIVDRWRLDCPKAWDEEGGP